MARGAQAIAEGLALGGYQYTTFKSKSEPSKLTRAAIVGGGGKRTQTAIDSGIVLAEAASWARDLVNEPGGSLTPPELAKRVAKRSEEHTYELQSLMRISYDVFCLKKKRDLSRQKFPMTNQL